MQVKMYTRDYCSFCYAAKNLLTRRSIAYEEIPISGDPSLEQEMRDLTGGNTVPQILIDGKAIGGYTELVDLDMDGKLEESQ